MNRRDFIRRAAASGCLLGLGAGRLFAQENRADAEERVEIDGAARRAVDAGLAFLASQQQDDGAFGVTGYRSNVAVCGLAGMALMSAGSTPGRGPYGKEASRLLEYVLGKTRDSGFIVASESTSHGPMYGHGFATLYLAECYGMAPQSEVRDKLGKAVKLIVNTQNEEGGWRYEPKRADADISVTVCQVMALRAARNAGIHVPSETIDRAVDYVKACQNSDGGFRYVKERFESAFPRSAAAIVALYSAGIYEGAEIERGLAYLMRYAPGTVDARQQGYFFYGQYYAVQAMWHAGGKYWAKWYPAVRQTLLAMQADDGSWNEYVGREYATAMACIVLQMPNSYLPIFQR